jgi:hypothetical protein
VYIGPDWHIRSIKGVPDMLAHPELVAEDFRYVRSNPHAAQIMDIFKRCDIEYGRIDYGLANGRLQVWEINSAPVLLLPDDFADDKAVLRPKFNLLAGRLYDAFAELDGQLDPIAR